MSIKTTLDRWWNRTSTSSATEVFNITYVISATVIWLAGLLIIAHSYNSSGSDWYVFGKLLFISAAAFLSGALGGFFFGIPKTLQNTSQGNASNVNNFLFDKLITNTNLEQISDWLTKIIVGLGLINLKKLPTYIEQLRLNFAAAFNDTDKSISYAAIAIVTFASISGFISMYVYTRVNISSLFLKNNIDGKKLLDEVIDKVTPATAENDQIKEHLLTRLQSLK